MDKRVCVIIPSYNEADNIAPMVTELEKIFSQLPYEWEMIFVNDGSTDSTLKVLENLSATFSNLYYISFSKNFGKEAALKAGYDQATGDAVISLDADLQHPPAIIPEMIRQWENGHEVVYTQRCEDQSLPFMKRITSKLFYKLMNRLCGLCLENGISDFRLLDRKVVEVIKKLPEKDLFFRGLIKWVGFSQFCIVYQPARRLCGSTKYPMSKLLVLAIDSIISFSTKPLYIVICLGLILVCLSVLYIPYTIFGFVFSYPVSNWASVVAAISFLGGLQLTGTGVAGIYAGKTFQQARLRPTYIIDRTNVKE